MFTAKCKRLSFKEKEKEPPQESAIPAESMKIMIQSHD